MWTCNFSYHTLRRHAAAAPPSASARSSSSCVWHAAAPGASRRLRTASASSAAPSPVTSQSLGDEVRGDFPVLDQEVNGKPLIYLDSAATSQKPQQVLDTLNEYYTEYNSNVHRGIHSLSARSTTAYEEARAQVARFINAASWKEIVFTRNASESINLVANTWGMDNLKEGDEIVLSVMEHHSNIVPWQLVAQRTGAKLQFVGLTDEEELDMTQLKSLVGPQTKLISIAHVSNTLGCVNPVQEIVRLANSVGAKVLLDACQSVPHMGVDVQELGCDWIVASGHKMCAPTGIGFLWGRYEVLESMPPWMGGGEMIADVFLESSTYAEPPSRFEAGTPSIGEAIALGAACEYLTKLGMDRIHDYEVELGQYLYSQLSQVESVRVYGPGNKETSPRAALCSFTVEGVHANDIATIMDMSSGIAIRSGHHCTQPLHREIVGDSATARASLYFYNTKEEIDAFVKGLEEAIAFFK